MERQKNHLELREVELSDAPLLFCWRNCPDLMDDNASYPVSWGEHLSWIRSDRLLGWIAECSGIPCGYVHYYQQDAVYLSIYMMPQFRREGRALKMLNETIPYAVELWQRPIIARTSVQAACSLFSKAGFDKQDMRGAERIYVIDPTRADSPFRPTSPTAWLTRRRWWARLWGEQESQV